MTTNNRTTHDVAGASLFGQNVSRWPAWFLDAVTVVSEEQASEQIARMESNASH